MFRPEWGRDVGDDEGVPIEASQKGLSRVIPHAALRSVFHLCFGLRIGAIPLKKWGLK